MKKKKIWIAGFLVVMLAFTLCIPAFANFNDKSTLFKISAPGNTLNLTQENYLENTKKVMSQSISDDKKIESTCQTFLNYSKSFC